MKIKNRRFWAAAGMSLAALLFLLPSLHARMRSSGASGSVTMEDKDPDALYKKVLELVSSSSGTIASYNRYLNRPSNSGLQVSAQIKVPEGKAAEMMAKLSSLPSVKQQNFSDNSYYQSTENLKSQIDTLTKELSLIGPMEKVPTIASMAIQQKQNLERQMEQSDTNSGAAQISVSIQELGGGSQEASGPAGGRGRTVPLKTALAGGFGIALMAFIFGRWTERS